MVKVLFFGQLKELLDCNETSVDIAEPATVDDIKNELKLRSERWANLLSNGPVLVAINHSMSMSSDQVNNGDEVAFFPPVTGG
ncbi:MoaD/ThiS family protein [Colwelliaceae bacterium 6471]